MASSRRGLLLGIGLGGACVAVAAAAASVAGSRRRKRGRRLPGERLQSCSDSDLIRRTIALASSAVSHGNHPFGALLYDRSTCTLVAEAENTVETESDTTAHAELNLVRFASQCGLDMPRLTLFTSTEPCPMCAGAIYWAGIREVVYCCSEEGLYDVTLGIDPSGPALKLPCAEVFARGGGNIETKGPLLEGEGLLVHKSFWPGFLAKFMSPL